MIPPPPNTKSCLSFVHVKAIKTGSCVLPLQENLAIACDNIKKIRADMGGTDILAPVKWIIRQPIHLGHPRLLFLLTDGAVSNTGKVIELVRNHSFSTRYSGSAKLKSL